MQNRLAIGVKVNIKRTDGRVHGARVSEIKESMGVVSVEWLEGEETKGKDVSVEMIKDLNPDLSGKAPTQPPVQPPVNRNKAITHPAGQQQRPQSQNPFEDQAPAVRPPMNGKPKSGASPAAQRPANGARSDQTAAEIDRIAREREERREKQRLEMERRREGNADKTNPNYEFQRMVDDYRHDLGPLKGIAPNDAPAATLKICVCVRKRPMNRKEKNKFDVDVATVPTKNQVLIHEPKSKVDLTKYLDNQNFTFDYTFDEYVDNRTVYRFTAAPLVKCIFDGGKATCFAYGQTGSGKTFTMGGVVAGASSNLSDGIYFLAAKDVFKFANGDYASEKLKVEVAYYEVYGNKVFDLLERRKKLRVLEDGKQQVQVVGLTSRPVNRPEDVLDIIAEGNAARTTGTTSANDHSSRSHAVFQIVLKQGRKEHGKFSLIDLAGNERGVDTRDSDRQTRLEGAEINKSLLALKECIRALGRKGAHTPFRASKLTQILRDSFIGENSKTCMIATVSPGSSSCEHTLNTLRYADRVKELPKGGSGEPGVVRRAEADNYNDGNDQDDLEWLRNSLKDQGNGEDADYMYEYNRAVTGLDNLADEFVEEHRTAIDNTSKILQRELALADELDNNPDLDIMNYVQELDNLLQNRIEVCNKMRTKLKDLTTCMKREEEASQRIKTMKIY